jgi:NDP-sugar pyrophosphorylase family protein
MQLVIPMSGIGKRFIDKGYQVPKPLISISGKPMVQHVVEMFPGIEEVLFIVNREHIQDHELKLEAKLNEIAPGCEIAVIESHKLGPAWAIRQARELVNTDSPVVVNYCDFACTWDFDAFRELLDSDIDGLIATYSGFHPHMLVNTKYAYLKLDENGFLSEIQEKLSFTDSPMKEPASSGTYGFRSGRVLLDALDSQIELNHSFNNEFYSSLTYKSMVKAGMKIKNFEIQKFFQWGTPEDFEEFRRQKDFFCFRRGIRVQSSTPDRIEVLAAGAGQRFVDAGYTLPKPFLPIGDSFLAIEALNALTQNETTMGLLLQKAFDGSVQVEDSLRKNSIEILTVDGLTSGQAASAIIALNRRASDNCIIATCDSLLFPKLNEDFSAIKGKTMGVWVTSPSVFALTNPKQFGWVRTNASQDILETWVKEIPKEPESAMLITGTFIFGDSEEAKQLLENFLKSSLRVNGEFYLDSVLRFASENGWAVKALEPEWFISLGTPAEYETYLYWDSLFKERLDLLLSD